MENANFNDHRLLEFACSAFAESSVNDRLEAIDMLEAAFGDDDCDEEQIELMNVALGVVLKISFRAAPRWRERACIVRLAAFLAKLCDTHAQARTALAKTIVQAAGKKSLDEQAAYTIMNWSLTLLPKLEGKAQSNQVLAAAQCLTRIAMAAAAKPGSKPAQRQLHTASKAYTVMLGAVDAAAPAFMAAFLEDAAAGGGASMATGVAVVLSFLAERGVLATYKERLGEAYCNTVLGAKKRPDEADYGCFDPFIASLTEAELSTLITPAIPRSIKRGPDNVGPLLARLAATLTCDLGAAAREILMPFAVGHCKDGKPDRCEDALKLVCSIATSTTSAALITDVLKMVVEALSSASLPEQRVALAEMIGPLASTAADLSTAAPDALGE